MVVGGGEERFLSLQKAFNWVEIRRLGKPWHIIYSVFVLIKPFSEPLYPVDEDIVILDETTPKTRTGKPQWAHRFETHVSDEYNTGEKLAKLETCQIYRF